MVPRWLLLVPFALITYFTWVKSIQQQRLVRPVSTLAQRDAHRAVHALKNRKNAWAAASVEQQELVPQQVHADTAQQQTHVDAPQQQQQEPQEQRRPTAVTSCPASRKPYHTLLTATAQVYQQWQCRVRARLSDYTHEIPWKCCLTMQSLLRRSCTITGRSSARSTRRGRAPS